MIDLLKRSTMLAAVLLVATTTASARGQAAPATGLEHIPHLVVRGEAILEKPADQFRLSLGVVTEGGDAAEALTRNAERMTAVQKALQKAGLAEGEYETGRFNVQPMYSRRPRNADAEWVPRIVGYKVMNTVSVRTTKLKLAGTLIDVATEAGVNSIDSIVFDLADPRTHRAEAIRTATANARADAEQLADAASLELVKVLRISLDETAQQPFYPMARGGGVAMEAAMARALTPITAGDVTVRATVDLIYAIAPRR